MNNPSEKKLEALKTSLTNLTTSWEKRLNGLHAEQKMKAPLKNLEKSAKKLGNNMQRFKTMNKCLQELKQLAEEKQDYLF